MSKNKVLLLLVCLVIGYIFIPIVFENIPLPGIWFGSFSIYVIGLLWIKPKLFICKQMIIVYSFIIIYYFLAPSDNSNPESRWFTSRIMPLFIGVSLYTYYFNFSKDFSGMRRIFWFTFTILMISCITTLIGLERFPEASRELASSVYGDAEMTRFYYRIGIMGYGFITSLAYLIPFIILLFQKQDWKNKKILFLLAGILTTLTVIKAQYTTQFLLFILALILSISGVTFFNKYKLLIIIPIIIIMMIPKNFYISSIYNMAELVPGDILKSRLFDITETMEVDEFESANTHVTERYKRIPFLLSEFSKNPLIGGGKSTGHIFWLDHLSLFGIIGIIPWIALLRDNYRNVKHKLKGTFGYYQISMLMFIILGFMKGSGNREQYIILFFILPLGLFLYENGLLFKKKIRNIVNKQNSLFIQQQELP